MKKFRHCAGFGKRIEFWVIGEMLKQGLDVYIPLVDDDGIDAIVRRNDGSFAEIQIKSRSDEIDPKHAALFAAIKHELRDNYWFVFYSELINKIWIMSSREFIEESRQNKTGKNAGKRTLKLNGCKNGKAYPLSRFDKYLEKTYSRLVI